MSNCIARLGDWVEALERLYNFDSELSKCMSTEAYNDIKKLSFKEHHLYIHRQRYMVGQGGSQAHSVTSAGAGFAHSFTIYFVLF